MPAELTSFVGRNDELLDIERLASARRMVTLTGAGGSGKTRLALRTATRLADTSPDGVWLVDLGAVTEPLQVPRLVATTVGVLVEPGGDQNRALAAQLRGRRMVLCLDTCEHLLDATAALAETVLRTCPDVSILATSREPLGVEGEAVWRVPSLTDSDALRLFVDRATLAAPGFEEDPVLDEVRAVCTRVDHLPLAVELAAAWVRALSPGQIAAGLDDSFRMLAGGSRRAIPRHQTLLASMAWSHALLDDDEQTAFRRLAVFSGAFSLEAMTAVCGDDGPLGSDALDMVGRLVDKSLVTVRQGDDEVRYRLLDTVRQYGEEQLAAAGETELVRDRHLDHFLGLAEGAAPGLEVDQDTWRRELDSHHDNISAALLWGLALPTHRAERGRRLAAAMARQWFIRGQAAEGLESLARAVDLDPDDRSPLQGRLLAGTAMLGMVSGRTDLVADTAERGLGIATETGDEATRARCLTMAAYPYFFVDFERCQALCAEGRAAGEAAGDVFSRDWAAVVEAYTLQTRGRHDEAVALARLAYEGSWPRGDRFCAAFARGVESFVSMVTGDVRGGAAIGEHMLEIVTPLGDYFAVGTNTANAALAMGMNGNIAEARRLMAPIVRSLDSAPAVDVVGFMVTTGLLALWDGDLDDAVRWFERGVARLDDNPRDWTATRCLPGLVATLRRLGRTDEAADYAAKAVPLATGHDTPFELTYLIDEQALLVHGTNPDRARALHHDALALRTTHGLRTGFVDSLEGLTRLEADAGNHEEAVRLLATSDTARADMGYPRPPVAVAEHEALVGTLRAGLGEEPFATLWDDGASRSLDVAVAGVTRGRGPRTRPSVGWESLTPTELEVVRLAREGLSNPEIATRLYMSRSTVKAHLAHVYSKLGVANRTELATVAGAELGEE